MGFERSQFPVRLLMRCPTCRQWSAVAREDYIRGQTFCTLDKIPLTIHGVSVGLVPPGGDWPELIGTSRDPPSPLIVPTVIEFPPRFSAVLAGA